MCPTTVCEDRSLACSVIGTWCGEGDDAGYSAHTNPPNSAALTALPPSITHVDVHNNRLTLFPAALNPHKTRYLARVLAHNNLMAMGLPGNLGELPHLTDLNLGANRFEGGFPAAFAGLSTLRRLVIENNLLTGELPFQSLAGRMPQLKHVEMQRNEWTDPVGTLTELRTLWPECRFWI